MKIEKFDFKGQFAAGLADLGIFSIREIRGNPKSSFFPFSHELQSFGPSLNHLIEWELCRLTTFVGAVENFTILCFSLVVNCYRAQRVWAGANLAGSQEFVL